MKVALAVVTVAACARVTVTVPGSPVPQSLQTLAVVLVGAVLGARLGVTALVVYVVVGAAGLPVFADGAAGIQHLHGPTAGYLFGFVAGAWVMGDWVETATAGPPRGMVMRVGLAFVGAVLAHAVILLCGWARLAVMLGGTEAWASGVAPFVWGGVAKSAAAAVVGVWVAAGAPPTGTVERGAG